MTEKIETRPPVKTIEVGPDDLAVLCGCRKVTLFIKGGKRELRQLDMAAAVLREACTIACGCKVMLVNAKRKTEGD